MRKVALASFITVALAVPAFAQEPVTPKPADAVPKTQEKPAADPNEKILHKLDVMRISLNLDETPASEVFDFLNDITNISFVVDPNAVVTTKVSLTIRDAPLKGGLDAVFVKLPKLRYEVFAGVIFVSPKDSKWTPPTPPKLTPALTKKLEQSVTVNFNETSLSEVTEFLDDTVHVKVDLTAKVSKLKVSFQVKEVRVAELLLLIERLTETQLDQDEEGGLTLKKRSKD